MTRRGNAWRHKRPTCAGAGKTREDCTCDLRPDFGRAASAWYEKSVSPIRDGRAWPFLPVPILLVVALALLVTFGVGLLGLMHVSSESDTQAQTRSTFLANTLAARLAVTAPKDRVEVLTLAAHRTDEPELLWVDDAGIVRANLSHQTLAPDEVRNYIARASGEAQTSVGRAMFAVARISEAAQSDAESEAPLLLLVFVRAPSPPQDAPALVASLLALTFLLILVAGSATYSVAFDALGDVGYVTRRIQDMTRVTNQPAGEYVAARTMDEVGMLTVAFNDLHDRFVEAEARYRTDLARAREQDKNRAAFLAAVSHELRSPLHAILGFADVLESEVDGPLSPGAREDVEQIRASGTHLSRLISDILEFSALEGGQLRLKIERCELRSIAEDVVKESAALIGLRPIVLSLTAERKVYIAGDATRIRQILGNLVGNALKFTQVGSVNVRVWEERGEASVSVLDTGPGIRPEERSFIFDDFKQSKQERMRRRGTGLGLAIARRLVALHGAKIKLASDVGRGSEFRVVFRVANRLAQPTSLPKMGRTPPAADSSGGSTRAPAPMSPPTSAMARALASATTSTSNSGPIVASATSWGSSALPMKTVPPPPPNSSGALPHRFLAVEVLSPDATVQSPSLEMLSEASLGSPDDTVRSDAVSEAAIEAFLKGGR
jgi:signal transduction histidine kinase